jgi:8-oxo-dGTP pyrophosphatase MutT (NUDIX family)
MAGSPEQQRNLIPYLRTILTDLTASPYPELPNPEGLKKRASVALILRVNPSYSHWPEPQLEKPQDVNAYFDQQWVKHGEPEVLFIKRASRKGDRWTSHIALPGGKRDPTDKDDQHAAVRESWEEVGVDLDKHAIPCGNLPARLVTTHWGKQPLLVLCPYVFVVTTHELPPLKLQPSEVASTHWVPLRSLLSPEQRTIAFEDVSSRIANQETGAKKWMLSTILGKMIFAAIALEPTESLHSVETPVENPLQDNRHARLTSMDKLKNLASQVWRADLFNQYPPPRKEGPLLLWGLTLGVISDFLDLVPPHDALNLWTYPTFTPLDVRFTIWLMTYRFKNRKRAELQSGAEFRESRPSFGGASESVIDVSTSNVLVDRPDETGFHGLGTGLSAGGAPGNQAAVSTMLEGFVEPLARLVLPEITNRGRYYDIVRKAITVALVGRASVVVVLAAIIYRKYWKR